MSRQLALAAPKRGRFKFLAVVVLGVVVWRVVVDPVGSAAALRQVGSALAVFWQAAGGGR